MLKIIIENCIQQKYCQEITIFYGQNTISNNRLTDQYPDYTSIIYLDLSGKDSRSGQIPGCYPDTSRNILFGNNIPDFQSGYIHFRVDIPNNASRQSLQVNQYSRLLP